MISDVTSPLLIETMAMVNNAHQMRSAFLDGTNRSNATEAEIYARLALVEAESLKHLARAHHLAAEAGLSGLFGEVERYEKEFAATLRQMTDAYGRREIANTAVSARRAQSDNALNVAEMVVRTISSRIGASIERGSSKN